MVYMFNTDFKLDYDTIKVHFTSLLTELYQCMNRQLLSENLAKNRPKQGIKSNKKLHNVKCAITDICCVYLYFY